jgi:hypothetical protein
MANFSEENVTMFATAGNKVVIGTQIEPIHTFLIENEQIAKNYTGLFNIFWNFK